MARSLRTSTFHLGTCYYPEQWPEAIWNDDFARMQKMGLSVVRIAEFCWTIFEPAEGVFSFDLFDHVMDLADRHDIKVIMGTPTATPPAWLTQKYPETLNVSQSGTVFQHGQRRHYNYNSPVYRDLCERIAAKMAEHYHDHPALMGWQIDNELNCEISTFYAQADHLAFRTWLKGKYGSLSELNQAWGTVFWSQTYTDWEQVHLTRTTPSDSPNPHQALDEKRFISDSTISFARLQRDAIRRYDKVHFITTNGIFGHLDSHKLTDDLLDFISYDSYPQFASISPATEDESLQDRNWSANLSTVRDISPQFCVMEQQSGPGGWTNKMGQASPKPGQMRLWTYQSIAHGADMVLYFRWRTATFGTEIYWHGINDYDNRPNRRCGEAAQVASELAKFGNSIVGSRYVADVAILKDYDNEWDGELDNWHGPLTQRSAYAWFFTLQRWHIPADHVTIRESTTLDDLKKYRVVVYPHPAILSDATAALLKSYVESGGIIVFGARTGYKDTRGHCRLGVPMPGPVADLCGVTVEEYTRIGSNDHVPDLMWSTADARLGVLNAGVFNDILHVEAPTVEVIATYSDDAGHYSGRPALVRNRYGNGDCYSFGGAFSPGVAKALIDEIGIISPIEGVIMVPKEVEVAIREQPNGDRLIFVLNYASHSNTIGLFLPMTDLVTGYEETGEVEMPAYGVMVFTTSGSM